MSVFSHTLSTLGLKFQLLMAVTKMFLLSLVEVGSTLLRKVSVYQTTGHHFSEYRNFQSKNQLVNPFHLCRVFCVWL